MTDDVERLGEHEQQAHRDHGRVVAGREGGEDDEERVVGQARRHIARADERGHALRELAHDLVGWLMSLGAIAQPAETVELEAEHADGSLVTLRERHCVLDVDDGELAAGEVRGAIDEPERAELFACVFEAHLRCGVGEEHDDECLSSDIEA